MVKSIDTMKKMCQLMGKTFSIKMAGSNSRITILTLNVNGLNQKTQTGKLDKKSKPIGVLYSGKPSHMQGHT